MNHLKTFSQIHKEDASIAGGKGASLGEMTNVGIPVPPGFVVLSSAFDTFLEETNIKADIEAILEKTHHELMHEVEDASEKIQEIIILQELPESLKNDVLSSFNTLGAKYVAVRSSATAEDGAEHAWAGQLDTYLNTTEEDLLLNVKRCWASLFTPRAIFYRFEKGLASTHISVAVVVQQMIESEYSGIAFSVHPVTEDRNQMIIEAGFGLGEAIVSGAVTPDSYVITKSPREIIDITVSEQSRAIYRRENLDGGENNEWKDLGEKGKTQVLNKEQILELADIIMKIENHYGFPCDIEWAYADGKFYITQSRPITTLIKLEKENKAQWKKLVTRESTFLERILRFEGYKNMLPPPFTVKQKDLLAVYSCGMTTQYIKVDDFISKIESIKNDIDKIGFEKIIDYINKLFNNLDKAKILLDKERNLSAWEEFEICYKLSRAVILYSSNLATFLKQTQGNEKEIEILQQIYDTAEAKSSSAWNELANFFELISKKENLPLNKIYLYTNKEFSELLSKSVKVEDGLLDQRENITLMKLENYESEILFDDEAIIKLDKIEIEKEKIVDNKNEIYGTASFKGNIRGTAKLILNKSDYLKINEGDILVTFMTHPDMVPILSKVSGIVTDEGGVLCHAAIVSRELRKPCIIGTKIATQVLHDGDLVEVDADNGVVRILEKRI